MADDLRAEISVKIAMWERTGLTFRREDPTVAAVIRNIMADFRTLLAAHPVQDEADTIRPALSAWLTLALDIRSGGPTVSDLLALRDWIDAGGDGEPPAADTLGTDHPEVTP